MECVTFNFTHKVEGFEIRLAAVVYKSGFVAMISRINAKRKEVFVAAFLDLHVIFIGIIGLVHIEQVAHTDLVIDSAPLVPLFGSENFPDIFENIGTGGDLFQGKEPPH
jgi:hypothetical protein